MTLRNHNEEIIQFLYGEDGLESSKLEKQYIDDLIDIEMDEFKNRFKNPETIKGYIDKKFNTSLKSQYDKL